MRRAVIVGIIGGLAAFCIFYFARKGEELRRIDPASEAAPAVDGVRAPPPADPDSAWAPGPTAPPMQLPGTNAAPGTDPESTAPPPGPPQKTDFRVGKTDDGRTVLNVPFELSRQLNDSNTDPEEDVEILDQIMRYYRKVYGENPVIDGNREVIDALAGLNPRAIVMFDRSHPSFNEDGELLDRYGTPYFFHAISEIVTDIVSAGPDGERGTFDDIHSSPDAGSELQLNAEPGLE